MTLRENCLPTQQLNTSGNSEYSGININVNGGKVRVLISQDSKSTKVWKSVTSLTKRKKRGLFSGLKQWLKKKCSRLTNAVQESNCGITRSSNLEFQGEIQNLPAEEHTLYNGVTPVTEDSVADDDCSINQPSGFINVNDTLDVPTYQSEPPTSLRNTPAERTTRLSSTVNLHMSSSSIFDTDDTSEKYTKSRNCNARETEVKQLARHQEDLQLRCCPENSSNLTIEFLKPFSEKITLDESTNYQDKSVNDESPDTVNTLSERSFSSGYPDITLSSPDHGGSTHLLSNDSFSYKMCGKNPALETKKEWENEKCFEDSSFQSKTSEANEERKVIKLQSSPKIMSDSLVADDVSAYPDSCSSRDTNANQSDQKYAARCIMKSNDCHENKGDVILRSSRDIESCSTGFTDKRVGTSFNGYYYVDVFHQIWPEHFVPNVCQGIPKYWASVITNPTGKIRHSVPDSTWNGKPQPNACADHRYFQENGKEQVEAKKYSSVSVLHKNYVDIITAIIGRNDAIELCELLGSVMSWKLTERNAMDDYTLTVSKSVCDRKSSDLDCLEKGKVSDTLVAEKIPFGKQTDKRVGKSTFLPFHHDNFISWLMALLWNEFTTMSIYQASLGKKPSNETRSTGINTVRIASLRLRQNELIITCRERSLDLSLVSIVGLNIHFSCGRFSQVVDLEEYNVPVSAGKNVTIGTDECLTVAVFQKQTGHNAMNDRTITDSRPVSDIESSDLDFVRKGKFSDKLVVTEEGRMGNQTERFSYSTLPSSCDVDVVAAQKKKTRKCKKKYRKKCKNSELPHGETSSLASSSWNESFSDDNSITFGDRYYNHQAHKPRKRKGSPENAKPPSRDNSDIKQFCSNLADSGIGASLDPVSFSWFTYDVDSKVIECHKRIKKIGSFGSLRHVKNSYSFKTRCKEFFRNQQIKKMKSIVRELRVDHRYLQFMHFGLGSYFDRLNNGPPPSLQEQMRYEWIRLASFEHYTGAGNALNLARNGFYHRHTDGPTSTRCAYCDETHSNWEYFDNIETVHRQMSPNCPFHGDRSEESLNVTINCEGPRSTTSEAANQNSNFEPSSSENSAVRTTSADSTYTLKPSLTLALAVEEVSRGLENTSVSQEKPSKTNGESVSQQPTEDPEGRERRTGERVSGLARTTFFPSVNTESRGNRSQAGAGNFVDHVGKHAPQTPVPVNRDSTLTTLDNVKHPEYRTMAQRVNSFQGFPSYLDQTPEQMALAGFYFVGVADFTRCFCCGGGLRNWEAGDDPLLEHTRWFPRCEYVLRLKGERYVAAVQRRHQEHMEQQRRQQIEIANQRDANRNPPDPMTTDAASVMREMGYADQRIRETVLAVRTQIGTHMITTQQVLSWLLDQDDDSTTTTAASSMYQTGNETNSIYTGINMASEEDDSSYTTAAPSSINTTVSTTVVKTRESVQGSGAPSGSNSASAASSGNGNQQTGTKSTAPDADASLVSGPSSQTGAKGNGKKKKAKGNTKAGQPASATGGPGTDMARKLRAENEKLRDMQTCKICMERPVNTTMLPCGHLVCCDICACQLRNCPVCRKRIKGTVKTFMS